MNDDADAHVRDSLRSAPLPAAPEALRDYLAELGRQPAPARQRRRGLLLVALVPIAAVLVGVIALMGGSSPNPSPTSSPTASPASSSSPSAPPQADATIPATVDGLTVQTVRELLAARAAGDAPGGPYALRGYWTERSFGHSCVAPLDQPGVLELYCDDGEWGITELDEPILEVNFQTGQETRATGPHLTPYVDGMFGTSSPPPDVTALFGLPAANGQPWPPVPIVVVGHFDDPRAAECRTEARQLCLDRFVIDRVAMFDPNSVPAPPSPTPFPLADPPPALFTDASCYPGKKKSFTGWATTDQLKTYAHLPGYFYAMVTRDPVVIIDWYDNGTKGHKVRLWARGVCLRAEGGEIVFQTVMGTQFNELDNGQIIRIP